MFHKGMTKNIHTKDLFQIINFFSGGEHYLVSSFKK
jgi:hypothetical protein